MNHAPIGVFDSGIGGLSVLKALQAELPHQDFIYLADSAHAPYGERSDAYVAARSRAVAAHLVSLGAQAVVVACNTATAAAIEDLRAAYPGLPFIGVEPALKTAAACSQTGRVLVMATRSTLASTRFGALLALQPASTTFVLQPCDGLALAIERSADSQDATEVIALCARYTCENGIFGCGENEIDTLVLGCTHYPFASAHLRALLGPDVQFIDNGHAVARQTQRVIATSARIATAAGKVCLSTTGNSAILAMAARQWLGLTTGVESLDI